jgi:hypothetical protein
MAQDDSTRTWRNNPRRAKRPNVLRTCRVCGVAFEAHASLVDNGKGRYCSKAHAGEGRRLRTALKRIVAHTKHPVPAPAGVSRTCRECGATFRVKASRVLAGKGHFHNQTCQRAWSKRESERRFWLHGNADYRPGHWLWTGDYDRDGYGLFCVRDTVKQRPRSVKAHQWAWFLVYGFWPRGELRHQCPYRTCFNPACLLEGNQKDNAADRVAWGRQPYGEAVHNAQLTTGQAAAIRAEPVAYSPTGRVIRGTLQRLAQKYGASPNVIGRVLQGKGYRREHQRPT